MFAKSIILSLLFFALSGCATTPKYEARLPSGYVIPEKLDKTSPKPRYEPADADGVIVFIHGVTGDTLGTWRNKNDSSFIKMVVNDFRFSKYNVYAFGYGSNFVKKSLSVDEVAYQMENSFASSGVLQHKRIIFISHSMGGLVLRDYRLAFPKIANKLWFAYFYSTPTGGSAIANFASFLSLNPQLQDMKEMRDSENYLANLVRNWNINASNTPSYCAYETLDTFGLRVVRFASAALLCNRLTMPIEADHMQIVKPVNADATAYTSFVNAFEEMSKLPPPLVAQIPSTPRPGLIRVRKEISVDLSNKPYLALTLYPGDSASVKGDMPSVAAIKYFSSDGQNCIEKKDFSNFTIKGDVNRPVFPEFYTGCEPGADQVKEGTALLNVEYSDNGQERDKVFLDLGWNTYMRSIIQENIGTAFFNANSTYYKLTKTFITNSPPSNPSLPTLNEEGNLCEIIREKSIYIDCSQFKNQTFEIHPRAFFSNGRWNDENVARVLNTLGKAISESGSSYTAVIRGYASSNELSCKTVAQRLAGWPNENFWLKKLEGVKFSIREKSELKEVSCEQGDTSKDGNYLLSFARAAWAAGILQKASSLTTTEKSNVAIEMIQPLSAQFSLVGNNRNDRRVSIRLQRYVLDSMTTD